MAWIKVKHLIWDNLIMYAKVAWARVVKFVKISIYLAKALLKGFDQSWGVRHIHCRKMRNERHLELGKTTYVGSLALWFLGCLGVVCG